VSRRLGYRPALLLAVIVAAAARPATAQPADAGVQTAPAPPQPAPPRAPEVTAVASVRDVRLGEAFSVLVTAIHEPDLTINLPATLPIGPAFEELGRDDEPVRTADGRVAHEFEIRVIAWHVGDLQIPPIPITYTDAGAVYTVRSNPVPVRVISVIGQGEPSLRDIAPPVPVYRRDLTLVYVAAGILAAALAGLALVAARRRTRARRERRAAAVHAARARRPDREALARLDALVASGALAADDLEPAFREMSEILRGYLARRYAIPALELTSAELAAWLREQPGAGAAAEPIDAWLASADLVKYAAASATEFEARDAVDAVRQIVALTTPAAWTDAEQPAATDAEQPAATDAEQPAATDAEQPAATDAERPATRAQRSPQTAAEEP
jgi:hypothetical protein